MTIDAMIAVLQAAKEGKPIEVRAIGHSLEWTAPLPINELSWDFSRLEYRVKSEPREWWVVDGTMFDSDTEAIHYIRKFHGLTTRLIHVREVLE